jgi:hypothetical protein
MFDTDFGERLDILLQLINEFLGCGHFVFLPEL